MFLSVDHFSIQLTKLSNNLLIKAPCVFEKKNTYSAIISNMFYKHQLGQKCW